MTDFLNRQSLHTHINKQPKSCVRPKPHIKGTNANYWEIEKSERRKFKCPIPDCKGSASTMHGLNTHMSNKHGVTRKNPEGDGRDYIRKTEQSKKPDSKKSSSKKWKGKVISLQVICLKVIYLHI